MKSTDSFGNWGPAQWLNLSHSVITMWSGATWLTLLTGCPLFWEKQRCAFLNWPDRIGTFLSLAKQQGNYQSDSQLASAGVLSDPVLLAAAVPCSTQMHSSQCRAALDWDLKFVLRCVAHGCSTLAKCSVEKLQRSRCFVYLFIFLSFRCALASASLTWAAAHCWWPPRDNDPVVCRNQVTSLNTLAAVALMRADRAVLDTEGHHSDSTQHQKPAPGLVHSSADIY